MGIKKQRLSFGQWKWSGHDCAERAVKLITDFKDVVGNVEEQNYLFQVVEQHRTHFKSFKKSSLNLI